MRTSHPTAQVAVLTARRSIRSAVPMGAIFAGYIALSAWGYATTYPTQAERASLVRTFGDNLGIAAMLGPANRIDTVGGFTAWRCLSVLSVVGAVWALLAATRLLRGEEDAGRWELLLAGAATRRSAAAQAVAGLAAGVVVLWAFPAVITALVGRSAQIGFTVVDSLWLAVAATAGAAMFLAVGAYAAQLAPTRRQAAGWTAGVLGVAYALRMTADSVGGLGWLRWTTPLGWVESIRPMADPRPIALLPICALTGCCALAAVRAAGRRDLGAAVFGDRPTRRDRTALLRGATALTVRQVRPMAIGWLTAITFGGLLIGLVAKSAGDAIADSPSFRETLARLGARGSGPQVYLGVAFLTIALLVALVAASQVAAARAEEADGRLEQLLVRPVSRTKWLAGRALVAVVLMTVAGVVAALAAWVGTASQHAEVSLARLLAAGANIEAPALVVLGVGVLALGWWPRMAVRACYSVIVWSFLVEIIGSVVHTDRWLLDTSLFHHMAAAPAVDPDWMTDLVLVTFGAALAALGWVGFVRRDITGE